MSEMICRCVSPLLPTLLPGLQDPDTGIQEQVREKGRGKTNRGKTQKHNNPLSWSDHGSRDCE